jgi:cold shock CspA family protein
MQGVIINASDRGFCFCLPDDGSPHVFASKRQFANPQEFSVPGIVGCRIEFSTRNTPKGMEGVDVVIVERDDGRHRDHGVIENGTNPDFMWIRADTGESFFAHKSNCFGIDLPAETGTRVVFTIGVDKRKRTCALAVKAEQS